MSKHSKKVLVYLFDSVSPDSFIHQQLGLTSLFDLFLMQDYYFRDPKKYFPLQSSAENYTFEFRSISAQIHEEDLHKSLSPEHDFVILWPLSQWPKDLSACAKALQKLLSHGSGVLVMGEERAFVLSPQGLASPAQTLTIESTHLGAPLEKMNISVLASEARFFNHLDMDALTVTKTTHNIEKGIAEVTFLSLIPQEIKHYFPEVLETFRHGDSVGYRMQRFPMLDVSRLLIHNSLTSSEWHELFTALNGYFSKLPQKILPKEEVRRSLKALFINKLIQRMQSYEAFPLYPKARTLSETLLGLLQEEIENSNSTKLYLSHGDLCFSNILVDRKNLPSFKLVDPRGAMSLNEAFLPLEYDFAKLSHCVHGRYDWILANNLKTPFQDQLHQSLQKEWAQVANLQGVNLKLVFLGEASLFLSMLPLHLDHMDTHAAMIESAEGALKNYQDFAHGH